jgi:lauroyl/myristoyl acyltransferase
MRLASGSVSIVVKRPEIQTAGKHQVPREPFKITVAIFLARAMSWFFWQFNRRFLYMLADFCGVLIYYLFPTYRANVLSNLRHVLGDEASEEEVRKTARRVFRTSGRNFADLMRVPHLSTDLFLDSVRTPPGTLEHLNAAATSGKGAILVTAHFGAFDYVGQIIWFKGFSLTLLTARTVPEFIDAAVSYLRGSRGAKMEPATPGGLRRIISALRRGELIGIVADRDFFQNGKPVTFFGQQTTLPPGPVRIARDTGAPILPTFARREGDGYFLEVDEPFHVPKTDDVEADLRYGLERLVAVFERHLRAAPDQWVMFQRVWTETPPQPIRVFPVGSPLDGKILGPTHEETGKLTEPGKGERPSPARASTRNESTRSPIGEIPKRRPSGSS